MDTYAGIFLFRRKPNFQLLLAHPGGPEWKNKEEGTWTIPLGLSTKDLSLQQVAQKSFEESLGFLPEGDYISLGNSENQADNAFHIWALEYQIPEDFIFESHWYELEWPPDSGEHETFPEFDRLEYFTPFEARKRIIPPLRPFIPRLISHCIE